MDINNLSISYPDFKLNDVIDPEQFDINNSEILAKINEILNVLHSELDGASGADEVHITPYGTFTSTTIQGIIEELSDMVVDSNTKSTNAVATANSADTKSNTAIDTANTANAKSDNAVSTANSAHTESTDAVTKANEVHDDYYNNMKPNIDNALDELVSAIDNANTAKTVSTNALATAQNANETSDRAYVLADDASLVAYEAKTTSNNAKTTANTASVNASNALANSNSAVSIANYAKVTADNAKMTAENIDDKASTALSKSTTAETNAGIALNNATTALQNANNAITQAQNANTTSGNAKATADKASTDAKTAMTNSSTAMNKSNEALSKSEDAVNIANSNQAQLANVINGVTVDSEVIDARHDITKNVTYPTLGEHIFNIDTQINSVNESNYVTDSVEGNYIDLPNTTVNGDMDYSLQGRTLKNEVYNGDFSKGTDGWKANSGDTSISNNIAIYFNNALATYTGMWTVTSNIQDNHKVYVSSMFNPKYSSNVLIGYSGVDRVTVNIPIANVWNKCSAVVNKSPDIDNLVFYIDTSSNYAIGDTVKFKEVMAIDLTSMFGAGNEPTKEWCDENLSYFDGIKSVGRESKNLLDLSKSVYGDISHMTGSELASTSTKRSDYIKVTPNTDYVLSRTIADGYIGYFFYDKDKVFISGSKGFVSYLQLGMNTPSNCEYVRVTWQDSNGDVQLEEGTTPTEYQPFGTYKIEVLSRGKNLLDGELEIGTINPTTGQTQGDANFMRSVNFILVSPNKEYVLSNNKGNTTERIFFYDNNKNFIGIIDNNIFTTPNNCKYIKFREGSGTDLATDYQLEEGTQATPYTPYTEDKTSILLPNPIRSLPNGTSDTMDADGNIDRNVGKVVLDGDKTIGSSTSYTDTVAFSILNFSTNMYVGLNGDNKFWINPYFTYQYNTFDVEHFYTEGSQIRLFILKSKLTPYGFIDGDTTTYVNAFKGWLVDNPTTVYYELATPVQEGVANGWKELVCFPQGNVVTSTGIITPVFNYKVPVSRGAQIDENTRHIRENTALIENAEDMILSNSLDIIDLQTAVDNATQSTEIDALQLDVAQAQTDIQTNATDITNLSANLLSTAEEVDSLDANKEKKQYLGYLAKLPSDLPTTYPLGISHTLVRSSDWGDPLGYSISFISVMTHRMYESSTTKVMQIAIPYNNGTITNEQWTYAVRFGDDTTGWSSWKDSNTFKKALTVDTDSTLRDTIFFKMNGVTKYKFRMGIDSSCAFYSHDGINYNTVFNALPNGDFEFFVNGTKTSLQELFTSVSNGKNSIATSIADMGVTASGSDTFSTLSTKIKDISKDATADTWAVVNGKTFYQGGVKKTGTMPINPPNQIVPSTTWKGLTTGYYDNQHLPYVAGEPNLIPSNIKSGTSIFGVNGTLIPGKRSASGTMYSGYSVPTNQLVKVTTGFKPSIIILYLDSDASHQKVIIRNLRGNNLMSDEGYIYVSYNYGTTGSGNGIILYVRIEDFLNDGFNIFHDDSNTITKVNTTYKWLAIE